jgi:Flp pilus assembly protein TadG
MTNHTRSNRWPSERGQALLETTLALPIVLLLSISLVEAGRAYRTWQVLTTAAQEGARLAARPEVDAPRVQARVRLYMQAGQLPRAGAATVDVSRGAGMSDPAIVGDSTVTVTYPFQFVVLDPVARLVARTSEVGAPITMTASAHMPNESPY